MLEVSTVDGRPALRGELDLRTAPALKVWLDELAGRIIEVDLSGVTMFDLITLRIFLKAREQRPTLRLVNPSEAVLRMLEITGTRSYLASAEPPVEAPRQRNNHPAGHVARRVE